MKTIHIKEYVEFLPDIPKLMGLIKELYERILKNDPDFHFFFEPELIIRIISENCLEEVKCYLKEKNLKYEEYEYPFPSDGEYGEEKNSIVARNLDLFLKVFHANSVAALTMSEEEHFAYIERLVHTACNPRFYHFYQEGVTLIRLAELKLGPQKLREVLQRINKLVDNQS